MHFTSFQCMRNYNMCSLSHGKVLNIVTVDARLALKRFQLSFKSLWMQFTDFSGCFIDDIVIFSMHSVITLYMSTQFLRSSQNSTSRSKVKNASLDSLMWLYWDILWAAERFHLSHPNSTIYGKREYPKRVNNYTAF
jgi:hypothetical protein